MSGTSVEKNGVVTATDTAPATKKAQKIKEPKPLTVPFMPAYKLTGTGGVNLPAIGFGTGTVWFKGNNQEKFQEAIHAALDAGFRSLDSAEMYGNEVAESKAIHSWLTANNVPRKHLTITSKVLASIDAEGGVEAACRRSLKNTGLDYFDIYLMHAPFNRDGSAFSRSLREVWSDMEKLVDDGLCRAIGVSNWRICDLEEIYKTARIKPVVNQVEHHPHLQQLDLVKWQKDHGILLQAYAPLKTLTHEKLRDGPVAKIISAIAARRGYNAEVVLLKWALQGGKAIVTTSRNRDRVKTLLSVPSSAPLNSEEMAAINKAGQAQQFRGHWTHISVFKEDPSQESD